MNRSIFFILLMAFLCRVQAQTLDVHQTLSQYVPASPEASAIASYQQYPVDYITGAPQVSVPLFEINTKAGKIPFSLSYHVGRIKASELTGPVGFGWTLTPNLGISRSVRGAADGVNTGYTATNSNFGNYSSCLYLLALSRNYGADEMPDNFYYSLLGKNGGFIYKHNGSFVTIPFEPIQISHTTDQAFQITDADGTLYKFGQYSSGTTQCLEYTTNTAPVLTSWKVTEIISSDKTDTVKFIYNPTVKSWRVPFYDQEYKIIEYPYRTDIHTLISRTGFNVNQYSLAAGWVPLRPQGLYSGSQGSGWDPMTVYDVNTGNINYSGGSLSDPSSFPLTCGLNYGSAVADANTLRDHYIDEMQLTDIVFRGGKVSLTYNSAALQSLILYAYSNGTYTQVKKVDFYQHTLTAGAGGEDTQPVDYYNTINYRALLDSLQLKGSDGVVSQTYKMGYTPEPTGATHGTLAVAGGFDADIFGFPIGNSASCVPAMPLTLSYKYCQITTGSTGQSTGTIMDVTGAITVGGKEFRSPGGGYNLPAMPSGMLQKLTYPTGGTAEFQFERNLFKMMDASPPVAGGGFRIAQIKYRTVTGADSITKVYSYGTGESGYGVIKYQPTPADFISVQYVNSISSGNVSNIVQKITTVNATPFKDLSFDNGAAVFYPMVTEYTRGAGANIGKTVYKYFIAGLNNIRMPYTPLQFDYRDGWKTSELSTVEQYGYKNGRYAIAARTQYSYVDITKDTVPVAQAFQQVASQSPASNEDNLLCSSSTPAAAATFINYKILPGAKRKQQETVTLYDQDDTTKYVQTVKIYDYDPATLQEITETETNSKNQTKQSRTWWPNNVGQLSNWPAAQLPLVNSLVAANRINLPIRRQSVVNNAVQATVDNYFITAANGQIYPSEAWAGIRNNALELRTKINVYDKYGNVLEQQKANDVKEVYLWGYNGRYPVAKVLGTDYNTASALINQTILDNPGTTDADMRTELNKLRRGLPNCQVSTYTYKPFVGITSETDPAGISSYYEYDSIGRLVLIKDKDNNIIKTFKYHYLGQQ